MIELCLSLSIFPSLLPSVSLPSSPSTSLPIALLLYLLLFLALSLFQSRSLCLRLSLFGILALIYLSPANAEQSVQSRESSEKPPLVLGQGEQRLIRISGLFRFSIGGPQARAVSIPNQPHGQSKSVSDLLLIKGISPGKTDLWVWKGDGSAEHRTIDIKKTTIHEGNVPLEKAISQLNEIEIIYTGRGVVLRGEVTSISESAKIMAILTGFPKDIHDETELGLDFVRVGQKNLQEWLGKTNFSSKLRIESLGTSLWLRGTLDRPSEKESIIRQGKAIFPPLQFEIETLSDYAPTIYFRVFLIELKKTEFQSLGISWPGSMTTAFQATTGKFQDLSQMDLALRHLESRGDAKILSNPELVVRAPGEAELFAGGELPIQSQSRFYSNVSWKNYGLTLRLKVSQSTGDRARLDIFTEVSHLDRQENTDRIPGIHANRMKTQVDARFGVPLLLSGLLQQGVREDAQGLPWLRRIPILGLLFGSQDYLNERSELVAILYPYAAPPPLPSLKKLEPWIPKGMVPLPRDWISPEEEKRLRSDPQFPWNVLE